jgi:APA family basic amino acid/polyamine antiporter
MRRPLGPAHVAAVVIGATVGVGIFFTPATLARMLPSPTWVMGIWVLGGLIAVAGAFVFAELGARFPAAGGVYVFLREGFGPRAGPPTAFLYGWLQLLVVQPGAMGVVALVLVDHAGFLGRPLAGAMRTLSAIGVIALFTAANLLGLRTGGRIQLVMSSLKVIALALVIAAGIGLGDGARLAAHRVVSGSWPVWLAAGMIPVQFTFGGAYHGTFIAGSVRDPERSLPRGIVIGVAVVLLCYVGVNLAYLRLLGQDGLAASSSPAAEAASLVLGALAGKVVAVIIVISAAGILNTMCLGFPFVVYAMARDGLFFRRAGELHPRTGRPALAVAAQGGLACAAVLVGSSRIDTLLTGIMFADVAFQALAAGVALRYRARSVAAWIFLVALTGIAIGCLVRAPIESSYGVGLLLLGLVTWAIWKR